MPLSPNGDGPASPYHAHEEDLPDPQQRLRSQSRSTRTTPNHSLAPFRAMLKNSTDSSLDPHRIRNEWVDALFGTDFFPSSSKVWKEDSIPPLKGVGTAGIPSYVAYSAILDHHLPSSSSFTSSNSKSDPPKMGVTISRLPLGVYVSSVEDGREASAAGVIPGSLLVEINGMGVLGEPSHKLLERLWQYEGFGGAAGSQGAVTGMVAMKFLRHGKLYDAMFLNKPPFGISWAPCGNFALVQRSYSYAQKAGIKRGCIIASVNGISFRQLDHVSAAETLRELFRKKEKIQMTLAYTPAASRSSFFASLQDPNPTTPQPQPPQNSSTALSFLQTTMNCGAATPPVHATQRSSPTSIDPITQLAEQVASGDVPPASSYQLKQRTRAAIRQSPPLPLAAVKYSKCPELDRENFLDQWNIVPALWYCLKVGMADYTEEHFSLIPQWDEGGEHRELGWEHLDVFGINEISMFLLQIMAVIGNNQDRTVIMGERLGSAVIDLIKENDDVCFYFHFLLLSFLGSPSQESSSYSTLMTVKETLSTRLAELESTRSVQQMQTQFQNVEYLAPNPSTFASNGSKSSDRMQEMVDDVYDKFHMTPLEPPSSFQSQSPSPSPFLETSKKQTEDKPGKKKKKGFMKRLFRKKSKGLRNGTSTSEINDPIDNPSFPNGNDDFGETSSTTKIGTPKSQTSHFPLMSPSTSFQSPSHNMPSNAMDSTVSKRISPFQIRHTLSSSHPHTSSRLGYMSTYIKQMDIFLSQLDDICFQIQNLLIRTHSQKVVEWAMQPWNATKEKKLLEATELLRSGLRDIQQRSENPLINPVNATEILSEVDPEESFILPSAHFPLLLTFNQKHSQKGIRQEDVFYRTKVEVIAIRGRKNDAATQGDPVYFVQGSVAGQVQETGRSIMGTHFDNNLMTFDTRSSWGFPKTLSIKMKAVDSSKIGKESLPQEEDGGLEIGYSWIDLSNMWEDPSEDVVCHAQLFSSSHIEVEFDPQGDLMEHSESYLQTLELELRISVDAVPISPALTSQHPKLCSKKLLLYKHTEDIRQEMLALQFFEVSNQLLVASGLDLKIRTFKCCPVGAKSGFVEWVQGSVPLSEICERGGTASSNRSTDSKAPKISFLEGMEMEDKNGIIPPESTPPVSPTQSRVKLSPERSRFSALKRLSNYTFGFGVGLGRQGNAAIRNPIQDFLRSAAYDSHAPYFIHKNVMDTYIKSCAGYCILTYLLGVGDRHLDNLLLHPHGHFLHCDFSFILGQDPKTYIPMRITEEMVMGFGGKESDNYAKFLSFAGAAFVALRRHSNLRVLMSLIRLMVGANLPDVSMNQSTEDALYAMRYRFRLDLNEDDALTFIEKLIERSISSKIWVAVDAMHSIGKKF